MSDRYTKKDAERAFELLCSALGKRKASSYNDVGGWLLDYASCYGGYVVGEIVNEAGGEGRPLGETRRTAREFCAMVNFAIRALEVAQR